MCSPFRLLAPGRMAGLLVVLGFAAAGASPVSAGELSAPTVKVVQSGADELLKDLEFLFGLTTSVEQKQYKVIKEFLDVGFLPGIDTTLPVCVDVKFGNPSTRQVWCFPINNFNNFRNVTLKGMAIVSKQKGAGLFELSSEFKGWMKYAAPYANIGKTPTDLPAGDPRDGAKELLAKKYDVAAEARNTKIDAASQSERRKDFQNTRKELLAAVKKKKDDSEANFQLKKKVFGYQLDEAERFFVESNHLTLGWTTDAAKQQGQLEIELVPIAGTSLEKVISEIGTAPSYFANIQRSAKPVLSARMHHPLDELRKKNLLDFAAVIRDRAKEAADAATDRSAAEKEATKKFADQVFDMFTAGTNAGILDGFVEIHSNDSGKHTAVCGFRSADGTGVAEVLKTFPQTRQGRQSKIDAGQEGDVKIHEVTVSEKDHPHYQSFLGGPTLYIGASKDAVWLAAGENALAELKAAIKKRAEKASPPADAPFAQLYVKLEPWLKLRQDEDPKQGYTKHRKLALEAFALGADIVTIEMRQKEKKITGQLLVETGILRFAAKAAADSSKENLDTPAPQPKKTASQK